MLVLSRELIPRPAERKHWTMFWNKVLSDFTVVKLFLYKQQMVQNFTILIGSYKLPSFVKLQKEVTKTYFMNILL